MLKHVGQTSLALRIACPPIGGVCNDSVSSWLRKMRPRFMSVNPNVLSILGDEISLAAHNG